MRTAADYYDEDDIILWYLVGWDLLWNGLDGRDSWHNRPVSVDVIHGSKIKWADWH